MPRSDSRAVPGCARTFEGLFGEARCPKRSAAWPSHVDGGRSPSPHPQLLKHISVWQAERASAAVSHSAVESAAHASSAVSQLVVE